MPPCGGAPCSKRVEQEAELLLGLLLIDAEHREDPALQVHVVDTQRTAADLVAVDHEVVAVGEDLTG